MDENVGLQLAEKEKRERARIGGPDGAGSDGALEVFAEETDRAARRNLFRLRVERHDERRRVHLHRDGRTDHGAEERDHAPREVAQHDAGIG